MICIYKTNLNNLNIWHIYWKWKYTDVQMYTDNGNILHDVVYIIN